MVKAKPKARSWIEINRAPVLTLWGAVVAERLGFQRAESLTLGRAVAGLNAYSKAKSLGLLKPSKEKVAETRKSLKAGKTVYVDLLNRSVPAVRDKEGLRAVSKGKPISPESVNKYLESKFGDGLDDARTTMTRLARRYPPAELATLAYPLYEEFRPEIPAGKKGWGVMGRLSLTKISRMAGEAR